MGESAKPLTLALLFTDAGWDMEPAFDWKVDCPGGPVGERGPLGWPSSTGFLSYFGSAVLGGRFLW